MGVMVFLMMVLTVLEVRLPGVIVIYEKTSTFVFFVKS